MRFTISIIILLTISLVSTAQSVIDTSGVMIIFTRNYTGHPFYHSPLTGRVNYGGSMPKAATYIKSYRKYYPEGKFALINTGEEPLNEYTLLPQDPNPKIRQYMKYNTCALMTLGGTSFGFLKLGMNTRRNRQLIEEYRAAHKPDIVIGFTGEGYRGIHDSDSTVIVNIKTGELGVLNISPSGKVAFKSVDISTFPSDRDYERHFEEDKAVARFFYTEPLSVLKQSVNSLDDLVGPGGYSAIFHRFQAEITGAEISIFAPLGNRRYSLLAGEIAFSDIYSCFPSSGELNLLVIELTGREIKDFLEHIYSGRFNRVRGETENLLKTYTFQDGIVRLQNTVRNHSLAGINYSVNITREHGRKVEIKDPGFDLKKRYRVAVYSDLTGYSVNSIAEGCGLNTEELSERVVRKFDTDYRLLLREWIESKEEIDTTPASNWKIVPEEWGTNMAGREIIYIK